jgi:Fur family peroxide stress response transcriptional regulator
VEDVNHIEVLRRAGLRSTPQRLAIVREVYSQRHPSVAEVFEAVRRSFPTIGLATVYNTLRSLTERGLVRELPFANTMRFDANLSPHANLVCTRCGAIADSHSCEDLISELGRRIAADAGFAPESERVDIYGLCGQCAAAQR